MTSNKEIRTNVDLKTRLALRRYCDRQRNEAMYRIANDFVSSFLNLDNTESQCNDSSKCSVDLLNDPEKRNEILKQNKESHTRFVIRTRLSKEQFEKLDHIVVKCHFKSRSELFNYLIHCFALSAKDNHVFVNSNSFRSDEDKLQKQDNIDPRLSYDSAEGGSIFLKREPPFQTSCALRNIRGSKKIQGG
jgi:restriction endonuclease